MHAITKAPRTNTNPSAAASRLLKRILRIINRGIISTVSDIEISPILSFIYNGKQKGECFNPDILTHQIGTQVQSKKRDKRG